ncbi:MAG: hypothetical protein MI674_01940 [Cytophagales bacterium]|nr:hypothetical protein [Cytophagales bacterium]
MAIKLEALPLTASYWPYQCVSAGFADPDDILIESFTLVIILLFASMVVTHSTPWAPLPFLT